MSDSVQREMFVVESLITGLAVPSRHNTSLFICASNSESGTDSAQREHSFAVKINKKRILFIPALFLIFLFFVPTRKYFSQDEF